MKLKENSFMKHIFAVFKKEMKRFFTDKRMLISLFLPGILIFVLYTVMGKVMTNVEDSFIDKEYKYKIVLTDNYSSTPSHSILETTIKNTLVSLEYEEPEISYISKDKVNEYKEKLVAKEFDSLIVFDDLFEEKIFSATSHPDIKIFYNSEMSNSETLYQMLLTIVDGTYRNYSINIDTNPNVGEASALGKQVMSFIFPMITMSLLFSTAMSICPESIAGEKERGTLASILISPIKRSELAIGKILALSITGLASGLVSALGVIFSIPSLMGGLTVSIPLAEYILIFLIIISTLILFVSLATLGSTYAKSIKEASALLGPLIGLVLVFAIIPVFVDCTSIGFAFIPFINVCQAMSSVLKGTSSLPFIGLSILANFLYSGLMIFGIVKLFNNESIMFKA